MKRSIITSLVAIFTVYSPFAFCQYESRITVQDTKKLSTSHNAEITISILCIEGQKYIHELTYKTGGGQLSTNLVEQTYGNTQCNHSVDKSITVP